MVAIICAALAGPGVPVCAQAVSAPSPAPAAATASPSPAPSPTPTPVPAYSLHGAFSLYALHTNGVNATGALDEPSGVDLADRAQVSNGLVAVTKNTSQLQGGITIGAYALPVVGQAINPTTQQGANSSLYGYFPTAYLAYVPNGHVTVSAGQLATLLGQESGFTFQNVNVQRGIVWAAEPSFSRGVRATYVQGKFTGNLEYNDGFYSGDSGRAVEGLAGWAPSAATNLQVAFIAPGKNTPGNVTASIANKNEIDFMLMQSFGKLQLEPYVLLVNSPASASLGYTSGESALGGVVIATYAFNGMYSVALRYESYGNNSGTNATSPNADLVGYGPGSSAQTWTFTPAYRSNLFFTRVEFSSVRASRFTPGLAFGNGGNGSTQTRFLIETGAQF